MTDVFLSHNSQDKPLVMELAEKLQAHNFTVWIDNEDLPLGLNWIERIEDGLKHCAVIAVCLGNAGFGPWQQPEIEVALKQSVERQVPIIPVFLPNAPQGATFPDFLQRFTWLDLRNSPHDVIPKIEQTIRIGRSLLASKSASQLDHKPSPIVSSKFKRFPVGETSKDLLWITPIALSALILILFPVPLFQRYWMNAACTGVITLLTCVIGYFVTRQLHLHLASFRMKIVMWSMHGLCMLFFLVTYTVFTEEMPPESGNRIWTGLYSQEYLKVLAVGNGNHEWTKEQFLYDTERIYSNWSSICVLVVLVVAWVLFSAFSGTTSGMVFMSTRVPVESRRSDALVVLELDRLLRRKLQNSHVETVGDLIALTPRQLVELAGLNAKEISLVRFSLLSVGLTMRNDP